MVYNYHVALTENIKVGKDFPLSELEIKRFSKHPKGGQSLSF